MSGRLRTETARGVAEAKFFMVGRSNIGSRCSNKSSDIHICCDASILVPLKMVTDAKVKAEAIKRESESIFFIFNTSKMGVKGHVNGDKKYVDDVDSEF